MRAFAWGFVLLALLVGGTRPSTAPAADGRPGAASRWEYRVLTRQQVIDLGPKDLAAGLNHLGDEGWELVAVHHAAHTVDADYIFKRPRDQARIRAADLKGQIAIIETDVEMLKDRAAWAERMGKKGYLSSQQVYAEQMALKRAEAALESARRDLKALPAEPKESPEKERRPEK
jgi:hypothetical protein